ncbi:MAG: hypothetical protein AAFR14_13395 [Bacteroidota bacterium]
MYRHFLFFHLFVCTAMVGCSQPSDWSDHTRVLPDELRELPVGAVLLHSPNPNYAELNETPKQSDTKYVWKHATTVMALDKALQVVKAGSYIWYSEAGWQRNVQYSRRDFAKRFRCPKGKLEPGVRYTFEKNYRYGDVDYGGDALWYVIAEDADGNRYKGIGLIETESYSPNKN